MSPLSVLRGLKRLLWYVITHQSLSGARFVENTYTRLDTNKITKTSIVLLHTPDSLPDHHLYNPNISHPLLSLIPSHVHPETNLLLLHYINTSIYDYFRNSNNLPMHPDLLRLGPHNCSRPLYQQICSLSKPRHHKHIHLSPTFRLFSAYPTLSTAKH